MNAVTQPRTVAYELHGNCYVNLTSRCTLRCAFCPKFNGQWEVQGYPLRLRGEPDVEEVLTAVGDPLRYREVVFCGLGEPTLRLDTLLACASRWHRQGAVVRLNTDGLASLVHGRDVTPELGAVIDRVSISLNAQEEGVYDRHCRPPVEGAWEAAIDFARRMRDQIDDVTLTAIDGLAGVDVEEVRRIADTLGVRFRRRVLDQVG